MRPLFFALLIAGTTTFVAQAQAPVAPTAPADGLTRQERRELARRVAAEARRPKTVLSNRDREMSEALFVDGVKYVLLEDYNKALERLLKAYALSPENAAISFKIAEANLLSGNLRDATNYAEAAVRLEPKNAYYYLLLAQIQGSQKLFEAAARTYATLIKVVPNSGNYLFNLADLYLAQGKLPEALTALDQAEQQFGQVDEVSFKKQQIYLKQNKLDLAIAEGRKLIAANPEEPRYVLALAEMYAANNHLPEAMEVARQALKLDPDNPQAHLVLADAYRQQKQPADSEREIKLAFQSPALDIDDKVRILVGYIKQLPNPALTQTVLDLAAATVKAHPREAKAFAVAGDIQTITEHKREARDNYLKALRLDNSKYQIWQQVVLIDAELSQTDSLLIHTDRALELFPNQASLWFYNGVGHQLKKQPLRATKALEHGRKLTLNNSELLAQFDSQLGDAYHELKEYEKSDAAYELALAEQPDNVQALNNYAYFLSLRGQKLDKAKEYAAKAVKLVPGTDTYLDTYAWVLYKLKDYAGARTALEKALTTSQDATVIEHYGDVLWQLNERERAATEWQRARKAGSGSEFLDRKIKDRKLYE